MISVTSMDTSLQSASMASQVEAENKAPKQQNLRIKMETKNDIVKQAITKDAIRTDSRNPILLVFKRDDLLSAQILSQNKKYDVYEDK